MVDLSALKKLNAERWAGAHLTRGPEFAPVAKRLVAAKARYQAVEAKTGVPWFVIAVIHQRESSQNFSRSLAQGDPWDRVSVRVPKGRGPFRSWEEAAIDALVACAPHASRNKDWSPAGTLTLLESYNGLGYHRKGIPSPYIWSGTDQYSRGKYVADGVFDGSVVDKQLGCAGMILAMKAIDPSITFGPPAHRLPDAPTVQKQPEKTAGKTAAVTGTAVATGAAAAWSGDLWTAAIIVGAGVIIAAAILTMWKRKP